MRPVPGLGGVWSMDELWAAFLSEDIGLPMLSSLVTGLLIGFEREVMSKPAGLRTHALVCFASTLLMLAAARQAEWYVELIPGGDIVTDPTRMAHGVLTGIGFLCAGVIFREGASIHGLTTAASLWMTSAIGLLYGMGLYWLAVSGALATLAMLMLLRLVTHLRPQPVEMRLKVVASPEARLDAAGVGALLRGAGLRAEVVGRSLVDGGQIGFSARARFRHDRDVDAIAAALTGTPGILSFSIATVEETEPG
jgi:putative Mg2+ transporter-C (MgtC) family protein